MLLDYIKLYSQKDSPEILIKYICKTCGKEMEMPYLAVFDRVSEKYYCKKCGEEYEKNYRTKYTITTELL